MISDTELEHIYKQHQHYSLQSPPFDEALESIVGCIGKQEVNFDFK